MKTLDRVLDRNGTVRPRVNSCWRTRTDQFNQKSIRIDKPNHFFAEPRQHFLRSDVLDLESVEPVTNRVRRNSERGCFDLAGAASSTPRARPWKKCEDRSRRAAVVAEIEMITSWIIEIDRAFDESQTEKADIKVEVPLRIAGNCGDVMKAANFVFHQATITSFVVQLMATRGSAWTDIWLKSTPRGRFGLPCAPASTGPTGCADAKRPIGRPPPDAERDTSDDQTPGFDLRDEGRRINSVRPSSRFRKGARCRATYSTS